MYRWKKSLVFILLAGFIVFSCFETSANSIIIVGIVDTNGGNLNIRSEASFSSHIVTQIRDGSYVSIVGNSGNWYYVEYKEDFFGYASKEYIDLTNSTSAVVNTNGALLNVRAGASTNHTIVAKLHDKENIAILSSSTYWSKILFSANQIGYVYNDYLISNQYRSVSLKVEDYKQFDSRWAYTKVGQTNYTIKQIGCAITSLAITESYIKGYSIIPSTMESRLSFTNGGALYWPSNYKLDTNKIEYLKKIYVELIQGRPVIYGGKSSSSSHYIVITGYKGGNDLSPNDFLINDPGSSSRITLAEYQSAYPTFIKLVLLK